MLRIIRKAMLAEVVKKDIEGKVPYDKLLKDWSKTADELIQSALGTVLKHIGAAPRFCVIALGKLGGIELNYSSDVDLIFIYDGDAEKATRLAEKFIKILGDVFRVDTDLRPEGRQGPLVNTIDMLERYYEKTGAEWERQALIRARPVAGDIGLGLEFISRIKPFVFRRSMDMAALKRIRATKLALEKKAASMGKTNVKLGPGGIREVEFFVQALQMMHGGRIKELQVTNTFDALDILVKHKMISKRQHDKLKNAYTYLRRIENLIQAQEDRQVHTLPVHKAELLTLAKQLGHGSIEKFIKTFDATQSCIQENFSWLFETDYEKSEILEAFNANLESCANREEIIDSLPWFKCQVAKRIQTLDMEGKLSADEVSNRLTTLAEVILAEALKITREHFLQIYGAPRNSKGHEAEMVILGMGRLGSSEMDYGSDLDIIFIYDGDGETDGYKRISNQEYFTKLAQGILSTITLPTRYGKTYRIDISLRPSGNQGALISSLEMFDRYHRREASLWERQALLRARVVSGNVTLGRRITSLLDELVYGLPLPHDIKKMIYDLRERAIEEKRTAPPHIDIKSGIGGLADIEATVQYLQLKSGDTDFPDFRHKKITDAILGLGRTGFISAEEQKTLCEAYVCYKRTLSYIRLLSQHTADTLDPDAEYFCTAAKSLGFGSPQRHIEVIEKFRKDVRKIYLKYLT